MAPAPPLLAIASILKRDGFFAKIAAMGIRDIFHRRAPIVILDDARVGIDTKNTIIAEGRFANLPYTVALFKLFDNVQIYLNSGADIEKQKTFPNLLPEKIGNSRGLADARVAR